MHFWNKQGYQSGCLHVSCKGSSYGLELNSQEPNASHLPLTSQKGCVLGSMVLGTYIFLKAPLDSCHLDSDDICRKPGPQTPARSCSAFLGKQ